MFELNVSEQDILSHLYLATLVNESGLSDFTLDGKLLNSVQKPPQANFAKLVIFAEGLHLRQLSHAVMRLSDYLEVNFFSVVRHPDLAGFAICAHVKLTTAANINAQLEETANALSIELCLSQQLPSLTEPGLLLMDMDSTVIAVECIDEIAALAGVGEEVAAVTAQAMQGKLDFAQSLRTRVGCLAGAEQTILQQVRDALPLMPGVANLVKVLKTHGWKVAIASGGFTYFADYLRDRLQLDAAVANELEIVEGKLTGQVQGGIIDAQVKADTLHKLAKQWSIRPSQTIAMGDGANDLVMMEAAALGVALHAKPVVRQQADMAIRRGGLDALLWVLQAEQG